MSRIGFTATAARMICLLLLSGGLLLLALPTVATAESTVHGSVYDWSTFNTLNNAVVEVYSTPGQAFVERTVAKSGNYTFNLPPGSYLLSAKAGTPGTPGELVTTENLTITDNGDYVVDLILFPPAGLDDLAKIGELENESVSPTATVVPQVSPEPAQARGGGLAYLLIGAISIVIILVLGILAFLVLAKKRQKDQTAAAMETPPQSGEEKLAEPAADRQPAAEELREEQPEGPAQPDLSPKPVSPQDQLLPQDCREVVAIMEKQGGRITQLDLRKQLPYSEAKVSLIVSDLESRGLVKKIKKGRGNVLILIRPGEKPPE